jgi:uncharacterized protein
VQTVLTLLIAIIFIAGCNPASAIRNPSLKDFRAAENQHRHKPIRRTTPTSTRTRAKNTSAVKSRPPTDPPAQCLAGDGQACLLAGMLHEQGNGVVQDLKKALNYYRKGCDKDEALACYNVAVLLEQGHNKGEPEYDAAAALYRLACDKGEPLGCSNLGLLIEKGIERPADPVAAGLLYRQACDRGAMIGCNNLGMLYLDGRGVPRDNDKGQDLLRQACMNGYLRACIRLGQVQAERIQPELTTNPDTTPELNLISTLRHLCDGKNDAFACTALAHMMEIGDGVEPDLIEASVQYEDACERNEPWACNNLANLFRRGKGEERDPARAVELYSTACEAGFILSCLDLAAMHLNGDGIPVEPVKAVALLRKGCTATLKISCLDLVNLCRMAGIEEACTK